LLPACDEELNPEVTCFLMDSEGYAVSHPILFHPKSPQALRAARVANSEHPTGQTVNANYEHAVATREQLHVTYLEPVLANDLLQRGDVVTKMSCSRAADRTTQRSDDCWTNWTNSFLILSYWLRLFD
jgi:hypothetical protein